MRSYLVLTPPKSRATGLDPDHSTIVMADGFSWAAFLLPWVWLLWHRLWAAGLVVLALQIGSGVLASFAGFETAGALLGLATSLLVGLECRNYYGEMLRRRGFTLETVVFAQDRTTAEEMYFSNLPQPDTRQPPASSEWASQAKPPAVGWQGTGLGLFDHGGR